jgi:hypothetical protein
MAFATIFAAVMAPCPPLPCHLISMLSLFIARLFAVIGSTGDERSTVRSDSPL